jgi:hypothetical protein
LSFTESIPDALPQLPSFTTQLPEQLRNRDKPTKRHWLGYKTREWVFNRTVWFKGDKHLAGVRMPGCQERVEYGPREREQGEERGESSFPMMHPGTEVHIPPSADIAEPNARKESGRESGNTASLRRKRMMAWIVERKDSVLVRTARLKGRDAGKKRREREREREEKERSYERLPDTAAPGLAMDTHAVPGLEMMEGYRVLDRATTLVHPPPPQPQTGSNIDEHWAEETRPRPVQINPGVEVLSSRRVPPVQEQSPWRRFRRWVGKERAARVWRGVDDGLAEQ